MVRMFSLWLVLLSSHLVAQSLVEGDLILTPIIDGIKPYQDISDFKIEYPDSGRCTDESLVDLITEGGFITLEPVRFGVSCDIVSWGRIKSNADKYIISTYPLKLVRIQNPQSGHIYYFTIKDRDNVRSTFKKIAK
jgi:hypothetical protein